MNDGSSAPSGTRADPATGGNEDAGRFAGMSDEEIDQFIEAKVEGKLAKYRKKVDGEFRKLRMRGEKPGADEPEGDEPRAEARSTPKPKRDRGAITREDLKAIRAADRLRADLPEDVLAVIDETYGSRGPNSQARAYKLVAQVLERAAKAGAAEGPSRGETPAATPRKPARAPAPAVRSGVRLPASRAEYVAMSPADRRQVMASGFDVMSLR